MSEINIFGTIITLLGNIRAFTFVTNWLCHKWNKCDNCNGRSKDTICERTLKRKVNLLNDYKISKNTFTLRDIDLYGYSKFGEMIANGNNIEKIITVFAIHLADFFRGSAKELLGEQNDKNDVNLDDDSELLPFIMKNEDEFWKRLNNNFRHFVDFEKARRDRKKEVIRYLINLEEKRLERQELGYLELFLKFGLTKDQRDKGDKSQISCYIVDKKILTKNNCLSLEHVVYQCKNGQILTIHNAETKSLTVIHEKANSSFPYETISKLHEENRDSFDEISVFIKKHYSKKQSQSHLYESYRYVSKLPSIKRQWELQAKIITKVNPENIVIVGVGFGDEIDVLIEELKSAYSSADSLGNLKQIEWIDLDDKFVDRYLEIQKGRFSNLIPISKAGTDLLKIEDRNRWDCIICSFVLHDIREKENYIRKLYSTLKRNGIIVISEMFLDNNKKQDDTIEDFERKSKIDELYGKFCIEIIGKTKNADIPVNDGEKFLKEVQKTMEEAKNGKRDYFLTKEQMIDFLSMVGFDANLDDGDINVNNGNIKRYTGNEINTYLGIITARKHK